MVGEEMGSGGRRSGEMLVPGEGYEGGIRGVWAKGKGGRK